MADARTPLRSSSVPRFASRRLPAPPTAMDVPHVDAQARFATPPVHIYPLGGLNSSTLPRKVEGNERYLQPKKKPTNDPPLIATVQRERTSPFRASASPEMLGSAGGPSLSPPPRPQRSERVPAAEPHDTSGRRSMGKLSTANGSMGHDVSYLADRPGHGSPMKSFFLDHQIPPTQIPASAHVRVAAPLPAPSAAKLHTTRDKDERLWRATPSCPLPLPTAPMAGAPRRA